MCVGVCVMITVVILFLSGRPGADTLLCHTLEQRHLVPDVLQLCEDRRQWRGLWYPCWRHTGQSLLRWRGNIIKKSVIIKRTLSITAVLFLLWHVQIVRRETGHQPNFILLPLLPSLLPGHQQTLPSDCDRSLPQWGPRGQQDGCYVNCQPQITQQHQHGHTRVALTDRPSLSSDCVPLNPSSPGPGSTYVTHGWSKRFLFMSQTSCQKDFNHRSKGGRLCVIIPVWLCHVPLGWRAGWSYLEFYGWCREHFCNEMVQNVHLKTWGCMKHWVTLRFLIMNQPE